MGYAPRELFSNPQGNTIDFVLTYASRFQFVSHASIAVNRFLVLNDVGYPISNGLGIGADVLRVFWAVKQDGRIAFQIECAQIGVALIQPPPLPAPPPTVGMP